MNRNQRRYTKATLILFTYFSTRTLRRNHYYGNVLTNLLTHFNNVETVRVTQSCAIFHQRLYGFYHRRMLFVWSQVNHQICLWDQLFVGTDFKTVFGRFTP